VRRIWQRPRASVVVVLAVTAALAFVASGCGGGGGGGGSTTAASTTATTIGKGEGSLDVIEWPYYTDKSFAQPFEKQTGCIIHRKDAGTSQEMFALMHGNGGGGGGQYDLVSASGDASLRLIDAGDVQPIDINQIPSWKDFLPQFKSPAHNTVDGKHYGVSVQWGPNTLIYNTKHVKPAPTGWGDT
jgi:putative spermidine/putrescine transport system substrate-binding protein